MKATTLTKAAVFAGSLSFLAGSAFSQTAVSGAGGYTTLSFGVGFNLTAVQLLNPIEVSGTIDSEDGDTLTDADPGDLTAILDDADATYLLEITSGPQAGAVAEISNVTATTFDVAGGFGGDAAGADFNIRAASTLGETFGALGASAGLFPDDTTDQVWLVNDTGGFDQYFKNSAGAWKITTGAFGPDADNTPIFYPDGIFVQIADTAKDVVVTGMVKTTGTVVSANEGFNLAAVTPPVGSTIGNSGLADTINDSAGLFPDDTTDQVWSVNPAAAGGYDQLFQNSAGEWKLTTGAFGPNQDDYALSPGVFIQRAAGNGDTTALVAVPDFYANL